MADKFGIDFRRADYNSNGEPDEFEKDEEMEMIPTAVGKCQLEAFDKRCDRTPGYESALNPR